LFRVTGEIGRRCVVTDEQIGRQASWRAAFGNDRPVQIEIGPGKGTVLLQLAELFTEHNFLGIEWANAFCRSTARRVTYWQVPNVKMLRTDAREFIIDRLPADSVLAVHVYFPDPWHKKRHVKRRLFIPEFCRAIGRVLLAGGKVLVATDHEEYFAAIRENLSVVDELTEGDPQSLAGKSLEEIQGNYEAKFAKLGRRIFRLAAEKR